MKIGAVVLAAGRSSRMGQNKLLLPIGDVTVLDFLLTSLNNVVDEVIVVTGHEQDLIKAISIRHGFKVIHNPDYDKGMTTSFKAGLRAINADEVFLILGDQVCLNQDTLGKMITLMESDSSALLVSPEYKGKRGHPTLIRSALFEEFLSLNDEGIMRDVILRHEDAHRVVEGDEWCVADMDTPADYEVIEKKLRDEFRSRRRNNASGS